MTRIREWLSIQLIDLGLWVMPYDDLESLIRMSVSAGVDAYLESREEYES